MAISNAENRLVLATGNKSELSVGYCTLYGDTVGGLAVLGDVYKRDVYALARHANRNGERIPPSTIDKPPSAELAPDQRDEDDLPPYAILDAVLEQAIEGGRNADVDRAAARAHRASWCARSCGASTATSTSAASRRWCCAPRRRPSAAAGGCRSCTATKPTEPFASARDARRGPPSDA